MAESNQLDKLETTPPDYNERRKEDRSGCSICGGEIHVGAGLDMLGYCSSNRGHHWDNRRESVRCGCGKWRCPSPGDQSPGNRWACFQHPQFGFDTSDDLWPGDKNYGVDLQIPKHHTDGTLACETNFRIPEEQVEWEVGHAKWKAAQVKLPNLAAVMNELEDVANPLSFDGHDIFKFVKDNPELAAICLHRLYDTLHRIAVGKRAVWEIPMAEIR